TAIRFDSDGTLWMTAEGGLSRLKDGRVVTLGTRNGLPCDTLHWVIEDALQSFWMESACGLLRVPRVDIDHATTAMETGGSGATLDATVFDDADGVRSIASVGGYGPHVARSADGRLWFEGVQGVSIVDPRRLSGETLPPPVRVEQLTANRTTYDVTAISADRVGLPPLIRDLQIDYTALSLSIPEKIRFRYRLDGYDREWQNVGSRRP